MAICDATGWRPRARVHLSIPDRGYNYGLAPATARIVADHDLCAVQILYEDNDGAEAWMVTLSPIAAVDFALAVARTAGELDAEGDETCPK